MIPSHNADANGRTAVRTGWRAGLLSGAFLAAAMAVAISPGRAAVANHSATLGYSAAEHFVAGLGVDLQRVIPCAAAVALLPLAVRAARRRASPEWGAPILLWPVAGMAAVVWCMSTLFSEFKIQTGAYPSWSDTKNGWDRQFIGGSLRIFLLGRYLVPALAAGVALSVGGLAMSRIARSWRRVRVGPFLMGFAVAPVLVLAVAVVVQPRRRMRLLRSITSAGVTGDPFGTLFGTMFRTESNMRLVFERSTLTTAEYPGGAALLGLPAAPPGPVSCELHPFRRALPVGGGTDGAQGQETLLALDELSDATMAQRDAPFVVWLLMLESFRGDDFHAVHAAAPAELAPFLNDLFVRGVEAGNVVATGMWQAGVRTSQALSALTCGFGTLPLSASFQRDLGAVPMRCLTDVLVDAGIAPTFFYGGLADFDNMDAYLRHHGVADLVTESVLSPHLPHGWVGVSDLALFGEAVRMVAASSQRSRFALTMTLSNHIPYAAPSDLPAEVTARVESSLRAVQNVATEDDKLRLVTYSYTDFALQKFFELLSSSGLAERSIVIATGDHPTADAPVWKLKDGPPEDTDRANAIVPFFIAVPEEHVQKTRDPERTRAAVRAVHSTLRKAPVSQNDVPTMVLHLLSRSREMESIPAAWRWHSMGGAVSSPHFRAADHPSAVLMGINIQSQLFFIDAQSKRDGALQVSSRESTDAQSPCAPSLRPAVASLSTFLNGYARECKDAAIRVKR